MSLYPYYTRHKAGHMAHSPFIFISYVPCHLPLTLLDTILPSFYKFSLSLPCFSIPATNSPFLFLNLLSINSLYTFFQFLIFQQYIFMINKYYYFLLKCAMPCVQLEKECDMYSKKG